MIKVSRGRRVFNVFNMIFLTLLGAAFVYPYLLCLGSSLTAESSLITTGYNVFPKVWSGEAYKFVFTNDSLPVLNSLWVSVLWTAISVGLTVVISGLYAYPVSRENFKGKTFFNIFCMVTMVFSGGLIPTYLVVSAFFYDSLWAVVIPTAMNVWYMFLMRNYFTALPVSLEEAAKLDGAGCLTTFWKIFVPMSAPMIATIALFAAVAFWNNYTGPLLYLKPTSIEKFPIPVIVTKMNWNIQSLVKGSADLIPARSVTMAGVIVSTLPIILVYPFLQRYFVNGVMMGAVKE